jgi:pyruvate ferredoxin oxidoreductase gamma subunit
MVNSGGSVEMVEIRFHAQSGQRAMASAELTALAAVAQGKYAQAFPSVEAIRDGAQVTACVRVSDRPIRTRKKKQTPDVVVVLDAALPRRIDVTAGLKRDGLVIMNTSKSVREIRKETGIEARMGVADAGKTAIEINSVPVSDTDILDTLIIASQGAVAESLCESTQSCVSPHMEDNPPWGNVYKESFMVIQ